MAGIGRHPILVALVGCGAVVQEEHLPAIRHLRDVEVVAVTDVNEGRLRHVAERFGIPHRYKDVDALLGHPGIDAVGICIPARLHCEAILPVLAADKHVLIEKPPGLSLDDADQMIAQARQSSGKVLVGFHMRWHRLVRQARSVVDSGILGPIEAIRVVWYGPRDEVNLPTWRERRDLGGGALIETAIDHFDLWRFLLRTDIEEIFALSRPGRRDDEAAVVSARLTSGVLASAVFSERTAQDIEIEVCGHAGRLRVSCARVEGLELYSSDTDPASLRGRLQRLPELLKLLPQGLLNAWHGGDYKVSYRNQWRHFIDAIRNDAPMECTLEDGRRALQTSLAAVESATLGQPVRVRQARRTVTPAVQV